MLLAQLIPAGISLGKSAVQGYKAHQLGKTPRPQYNIPDAVTGATNSAKYQAGMTELPGQNLMQDRLGRNTSNALADLKNVSTSPSQLGANIAKVYGGQMNAENDLGIKAGQNWMNNQDMLRSQLGILGNFQNKQWDYNQNQPYQAKMAASSALREGAYRNLQAGLSGASNAAMGAIRYNMANKDNEETDTNDTSGTMGMSESLGGNSTGGTPYVVDPNRVNSINSYNVGSKDSPYDVGYNDYQNPYSGGNNNTPQSPTEMTPEMLNLLKVISQMKNSNQYFTD